MIGVFPINKIVKLYKSWKKENKRFVRCGKIVKSTFDEANDSFLCYLRTHDVTSADINLGLDSLNFYWDFCQYIISFVPGLITGSILGQNETDIAITIPISIIVSVVWYIALILIKKFMQRVSNNLVYYEYSFVRSVLQQYKDLYTDDIRTGHKIVQIYNNSKVKIPVNAESLYGDKMQCPKYYKNVFHIVVNDGHQEFQYVWYSNKNYNSFNSSTKKDFVRLCKEQIGKDWDNINNQHFSFKKLLT